LAQGGDDIFVAIMPSLKSFVWLGSINMKKKAAK
jgi:hypothetical protein